MGLADSFKSLVGANQKAILEIADFTNRQAEEHEAPKPSSGKKGFSVLSGFSTATLKSYASGLSKMASENAEAFKEYKRYEKYKFEVQFNPEEISINGYGGEEMPIQSYRPNPNDPKDKQQGQEKDKQQVKPPPIQGSHMAAPDTRIDMNFRLVFDKVNIQDAFFADKFTLSQTNIVKGVGTAIKKGVTGSTYSVQPEVEALTAIVRDHKKRLARFYWGDMSYEGVINHVNAEYAMFNVNGEPIRAFVQISMTLYDAEVSGANTDIWKEEYNKDFGALKNPVKGIAANIGG